MAGGMSPKYSMRRASALSPKRISATSRTPDELRTTSDGTTWEIFEQSGNTDALEKCDDNNVVNGDGCNPTCNLTGTVTTLATGVLGNALAVDDTFLWLGGCDYSGSSPAGCATPAVACRTG